jgi:UDP-N-acetyl-D-mannosaminuronate dehydrogenase
MSVSAAIVTNIKTDALLVPSAAVKTQGDTSYVQVFENSNLNTQSIVTTKIQPSRVTVVTGLSNDTSTEITSGLTEGQMVVIKSAAPSATTSATKTTTTKSSGSVMNLGGIMGGGGGPPRD